MIARAPLVSLLALLALLPAACKREAAPDSAAAGEILPGSASDAMLPSDRLTSQPPLDPRAERGMGEDKDKASATEPAGAGDGPAAAPATEATAAAD